MKLSILAKIIDLLFPRFCPMCGNRLAGEEECICLACNLRLPRTETWANPYENEMAKMFWHLIPIQRAGALFYFKSHSIASNIIYQLKYHHRPDIGFDMGKLLAQEGLRTDFFDGIDAIVPIPLTKKRIRQRGYNQCLEIAKGISSLTHIPIDNGIVKRSVFQESQTRKNRWARIENVESVFEACPDYPSLENKHLLIVDDVCTTGATILACCEAILQRGGKCRPHNIKFSILSLGWAKPD